MKKFLAILLLALLAFSGCSLFEKEEKETQAEPETVNADEVLDNKIFTDAVDNNDSRKCEKILNTWKKEECKAIIESDSLISEAVSSMDSSACSKIEIERYKDYCKEIVAAKIEEQNTAEKKEAAEKEKEELRIKIEEEAYAKGDASLCEKIESKEDTYSCKYNVIANQAIQKNDMVLCKEIGEQSLVDACESNF